MNKSKDQTLEILNSKKKKLTVLIVLISTLIILYAIYFVMKLISGTWQANNTLSIVGLALLVVLISNLTLQLSSIQKEIKSRNGSQE